MDIFHKRFSYMKLVASHRCLNVAVSDTGTSGHWSIVSPMCCPLWASGHQWSTPTSLFPHPVRGAPDVTPHPQRLHGSGGTYSSNPTGKVCLWINQFVWFITNSHTLEHSLWKVWHFDPSATSHVPVSCEMVSCEMTQVSVG